MRLEVLACSRHRYRNRNRYRNRYRNRNRVRNRNRTRNRTRKELRVETWRGAGIIPDRNWIPVALDSRPGPREPERPRFPVGRPWLVEPFSFTCSWDVGPFDVPRATSRAEAADPARRDHVPRITFHEPRERVRERPGGRGQVRYGAGQSRPWFPTPWRIGWSHARRLSPGRRHHPCPGEGSGSVRRGPWDWIVRARVALRVRVIVGGETKGLNGSFRLRRRLRYRLRPRT